MRFLLLLFFLFSFAYSYDAKRVLTQADQWLKTKQTAKVLKAYHSYKNVRINAIMSSNKRTQATALQGVLKAGKLLHIDVSRYKKEMRALGVKPRYKKKYVVKKRSPKKRKPRASLMIIKGPSNKLLSMKWRAGTIVLTFQRGVKEEELNYFALDKRFNNRYRYIFDIKAKAIKSFRLSKHDLYAVRLSHYDNTILRLVVENKSSLKVKYSRKGREIIIAPGKGHVVKKHSYLKYKETYYVTKHTSNNGQKVVVIDPGHGGKDTGAIGYKNYREKIIVYDIAYQLSKELKAMGYKTYLTRKKGKFVKLRERTRYANRKNADLFISIHANSVARKGNYQRHNGIETYFLSPARTARANRVAAKENIKDVKTMKRFAKQNFLNILNRQKILASNKLAIDLQKGALSNLRSWYKNVKDAGVREGPFWVLVGAQMPAVLVEVGFVTNPKEARRLVNKRYQKRLAHGLALGVKHYFSMNP